MASPYSYLGGPATPEALRALEVAELFRQLEGATVANATMSSVLEQIGIQNFASFNAKQVVNGAYANSTGQIAEILGLVSANFAKSIRARRGSFQRMYEEVGKVALSSVADSYQSINHGPSYRSNERFSDGKLFKAITSPQMYRASYDGIDFINTGWLDGQARQWYRLQFGAGPAQGRNIRPRKPGFANNRILFFGESTGINLSLSGYGPSDNFYIPPGFFFGEGGSLSAVGRNGRDQFHPMSSINRTVRIIGRAKERGISTKGLAGREQIAGIGRFGGFTKAQQRSNNTYWRGGLSRHGIAPQRFLDSGVSAIARLAPAGNEKLISLMAKEASEFETGPLAKAALTKDSLRDIQILNQATNAIAQQNTRFIKERQRFLDSIYLSRRGPRLY